MRAATSTANQIFLHRSEAVIDRLRAGVPLTEAVQALDESGEFRWRLANAAHVHGGFMAALAGWHDALDAKAYQQEQAASQLITTALVVVNGVIVGMICVGVFQALIFMEQGVALW
jgi:type II secretory pathway component PulF